MGTGQGTGQGTRQVDSGTALARGGTVLAASLLFLLGVFHFFAGIAGIARDNFYVVGQNYVYQVSSTGWGWIHTIGGVLLAATGLALFSRSATWARPVAIVLLVASAIANFFFLVYFPLWALLMIAIAIFCIWAIAREGSESRERRQAMGGAYGQQPGLSTQQREQMGTGAYVSSGQRWPENVSGREEATSGRSWAPSDVKEGAGRMGDKAQEHAQSAARGAGQSNRSAAEEAAERARQSGRDYGSGR